MNRGEVFWVDFPHRSPAGREITKSRPCVVVSVPALNRARTTVVMVPLSSNNKVYPPISIPVRSTGDTSVAICDQLLAVDKKRLREKVGNLSKDELGELDNSLRQLLGL